MGSHIELYTPHWKVYWWILMYDNGYCRTLVDIIRYCWTVLDNGIRWVPMEFSSSLSSVIHWCPLEFSGFQWAAGVMAGSVTCNNPGVVSQVFATLHLTFLPRSSQSYLMPTGESDGHPAPNQGASWLNVTQQLPTLQDTPGSEVVHTFRVGYQWMLTSHTCFQHRNCIHWFPSNAIVIQWCDSEVHWSSTLFPMEMTRFWE